MKSTLEECQLEAAWLKHQGLKDITSKERLKFIQWLLENICRNCGDLDGKHSERSCLLHSGQGAD